MLISNLGFKSEGVKDETGGSLCIEGSNIPNCIGEMGTKCVFCGSGFGVSHNESSCEAYTVDMNCRMLNSFGTCMNCWYAYYWDTNQCKLSGG